MPLSHAMADIEVVASAPSTFQMVEATESSPTTSQLLAGYNIWDIEMDPDSGVLYFSDPTAGLIGSIDPNAAVLEIETVIARPGAVFHGLALDGANNRLFFQDSADNTLRVRDLVSLDEDILLTGGDIDRPNDIEYDPVRNWLYFTDSGSDKLLVIKDLSVPVEESEVVSISGLTGIWGAALDPDSGHVYLSLHDSGQIQVLLPDTMGLVPVETGRTGARGLHFDNLGRLFCNVSGLNAVHRVCTWLGPASPVPTIGPVGNGRGLVAYNPTDLDRDQLADDWERRFGDSVHQLDGSSDPDHDGRSALIEMIFNGRPDNANDPVPTVEPTSGDQFSISFDGLTEGYNFNCRCSTNLVDWLILPPGALSPTLLEDPTYSRWQVEIGGLGGPGVSPASAFVTFDPSPITP